MRASYHLIILDLERVDLDGVDLDQPFRLAELHLRVRCLLRRGDELPKAEHLPHRALKMGSSARLVSATNQEVSL